MRVKIIPSESLPSDKSHHNGYSNSIPVRNPRVQLIPHSVPVTKCPAGSADRGCSACCVAEQDAGEPGPAVPGVLAGELAGDVTQVLATVVRREEPGAATLAEGGVQGGAVGAGGRLRGGGGGGGVAEQEDPEQAQGEEERSAAGGLAPHTAPGVPVDGPFGRHQTGLRPLAFLVVKSRRRIRHHAQHGQHKH